MTRIAIVGSRNYPNPNLVKTFINALPDNVTIVSGGARGVDSVAEHAANTRGLKTTIYKPDWSTFGKAAGMIRNTDIIKNSDRVVAFWDGQSRGTLDTITKALHASNITQVTVYK